MPYEYKRRQDCRNKSDEKGTYVTLKKGDADQKCWKSKKAYDNATQARHAKGITSSHHKEDHDILEELEESILRNYIKKILISVKDLHD